MPLSPLVPSYTGGGQGGAGVPTRDPSPGLPGVTAGGFVDAGNYWNQVSAVAIASARAAERLGSQVMQVAENDAQRDLALVQADMRMRLHSASSGAYVQLKDLESSIEGDASISPLDAGKRWREGAEKIRDEFAKDLSGDPLKVFTEDVDRQIGLGSIRLRDRSAVRLKDSAAAGLMTTLDGLARVAANAKTPAELNEAVGRAQDVMSDAVANGVLTASQAQAQSMRWRGDVDEARLRGAIQTDPAGAIKRIDAGEFPGLPPDRLQQFREHAGIQAEARKDDEERKTRQAEVIAERERSRIEDDNFKGLLDEQVAGTLTLEKVQAKRNALSVSQYQSAMRMLSRQESPDPGTYVQLSRAAAAGVNVDDAAAAAYSSGLLSDAQYNQIVEHYRRSADSGRKYAMKLTEDAMGTGGIFGKDAAFAARIQEAANETATWYDAEIAKGKVPSNPEIEQKALQIGKAHSSAAGMPTPADVLKDYETLQKRRAEAGPRPSKAQQDDFEAQLRGLLERASRLGIRLPD